MANKTPLSGRFSTYAQKLVAAGQAGKEMVFFPTDEVNETGHSYEFTPQGLYSYITDNLPSGSGLGDMVSTTYDPNNIKKDVYNLAYATGSLSPTKITGLAHIATSGSWFDIINRPTFATVATTGDYGDLLNKPTLGTASASDVGDFATAAQGAKADSAVQSVIGGSGISVDSTDPQNPVIVSTVTGNVAGDTHNADPKAAPVDNDELPVVDTEDLNILKKFTIANLKSLLESYFDTLYAKVGDTGDVAADTHAADTKATPHDDDEMPLIDSEDSFSLKKLTWDDIKTALKTYFDGLYTGNTGTVTSVGATVPTGLQVSGSPVTTSGTLAISYASGYQGYTSAEASKLSGIESSADVTDAGNVGSAIHGADAKTTPVDADTIALIDSAASNVLKKLSWSNVKATLKSYFDTLYAEVSVYDPTGVEDDAFDRANHHGTQSASTIADFSTAVQSELASYIAAQDVLVFKGGIDASSNPNYPAADAGHVYKITVAGKIGGASGPNVEVGDVLTCTVDSSAAGDHAAVGANWIISQVNIDGAVIGPASATNNSVAGFDGTSGKLIKELSASEIRTAAGLGTAAQKDEEDFQAANTHLDDISGLTFADKDIIQYRSGGLVNRSIAQLIEDLEDGGLSGGGVPPLMHVVHELPQGTNGEEPTGASWNTRSLNTVRVNEIPGASLASNQITLPAGTYFTQAVAITIRGHGNKIRLYNVTSDTTLMMGVSVLGDSGSSTSPTASLCGRFTLSGTAVIRLDHYITSATGSPRLGYNVGQGPEVYAELLIWKVA